MGSPRHGEGLADALRRGRRLMVAGVIALLLGLVAIVVPAVAAVGLIVGVDVLFSGP